jgi:hypothetical protein
LARLIAEANGELNESDTLDPQQLAEEAAHVADYETIHSRMRECVDRSDRARCALTLLLQQTERFAGYVFGFDGGVSLTLMAALPDEPSRELSDWASRWFAGEVLPDRSDTTADAFESLTAAGNLNSVTTSARPPSNSVSERYQDTEGRLFEASLMTVWRDLESVTVGVLISQIGKGARLPNRGLLSQIAALMLEHGDVKAVALEQPNFSESNTE